MGKKEDNSISIRKTFDRIKKVYKEYNETVKYIKSSIDFANKVGETKKDTILIKKENYLTYIKNYDNVLDKLDIIKDTIMLTTDEAIIKKEEIIINDILELINGDIKIIKDFMKESEEAITSEGFDRARSNKKKTKQITKEIEDNIEILEDYYKGIYTSATELFGDIIDIKEEDNDSNNEIKNKKNKKDIANNEKPELVEVLEEINYKKYEDIYNDYDNQKINIGLSNNACRQIIQTEKPVFANFGLFIGVIPSIIIVIAFSVIKSNYFLLLFIILDLVLPLICYFFDNFKIKTRSIAYIFLVIDLFVTRLPDPVTIIYLSVICCSLGVLIWKNSLLKNAIKIMKNRSDAFVWAYNSHNLFIKDINGNMTYKKFENMK